MKQKVEERLLAVGSLEEETEYVFTVRAATAVGAGAAGAGRVRTGPQAGSPRQPKELKLSPNPAALRLQWTNSPSGSGPLLGYYIEAKRKGMSRSQLIMNDNHIFMSF